MKQFLLALFFSAFATLAYSQELTPGTEIPKAVFYKKAGGTFSTDQIAKGKKTLLMFFDATCGHCQKTAAAMSKRNKEFADINLILVTQDEQRSIDYFMTNYGKALLSMKNVSILQDKDHVFIPLFHPKQYPSLYLFGSDRKLIYYSSNDNDVPKFFKLIKP
ncbi:peroxiredoxin family protein [Pedobacter frigoris]|uniref:peroxiredoxin family protein n=1 Tax=Pedobacter frigoris TaxID=2571272 RepID=UPI00292D6440|nr:redoxin domain-containing protein [Pedobacter frigoris]